MIFKIFSALDIISNVLLPSDFLGTKNGGGEVFDSSEVYFFYTFMKVEKS